MTPALLPTIRDALQAARREAAPADPAEVFALVSKITGIIGQNWSRAGRDEFIGLSAEEFVEMPGAYLIDALARARRRVVDGRMLVAWVCDDVDPKTTKLMLEIQNLERLIELGTAAA